MRPFFVGSPSLATRKQRPGAGVQHFIEKREVSEIEAADEPAAAQPQPPAGQRADRPRLAILPALKRFKLTRPKKTSSGGA